MPVLLRNSDAQPNVASNELSLPNADARPNVASVCIPGNVGANERWGNVRAQFDSDLHTDAAHRSYSGKGKAKSGTHVYFSNSRSSPYIYPCLCFVYLCTMNNH